MVRGTGIILYEVRLRVQKKLELMVRKTERVLVDFETQSTGAE